jgi:hypothetical protein
MVKTRQQPFEACVATRTSVTPPGEDVGSGESAAVGSGESAAVFIADEVQL